MRTVSAAVETGAAVAAFLVILKPGLSAFDKLFSASMAQVDALGNQVDEACKSQLNVSLDL